MPRFYRRRSRRNYRSRYSRYSRYRRRSYRPRGYRASPAYRAFRQIRNLQRQRELKYLDYSSGAAAIELSSTEPRFMTSLTDIQQGDGPNEMNGRRIKMTSATMNFTFWNLDTDGTPPTLRFLAFLWKEGEPPTSIPSMFTPGAVGPHAYWHDDYRFKKKSLMDRKFTFSLDKPVIQRTFRFKIPARYITTPGEYNNLYFLILSYNDSGSEQPYTSFRYTTRTNYHDS